MRISSLERHRDPLRLDGRQRHDAVARRSVDETVGSRERSTLEERSGPSVRLRRQRRHADSRAGQARRLHRPETSGRPAQSSVSRRVANGLQAGAAISDTQTVSEDPDEIARVGAVVIARVERSSRHRQLAKRRALRAPHDERSARTAPLGTPELPGNLPGSAACPERAPHACLRKRTVEPMHAALRQRALLAASTHRAEPPGRFRPTPKAAESAAGPLRSIPPARAHRKQL